MLDGKPKPVKQLPLKSKIFGGGKSELPLLAKAGVKKIEGNTLPL